MVEGQGGTGPGRGADAGWRVHAVLPASVANGPGRRFVIWSQGCTLGCPGCFNPGTHDPAGPTEASTVDEVMRAVLAVAGEVEGVTLTGGEPLQQPEAVRAFCAGLRARSRLGVVLLTGYTRREIESDPARSAAVRDVDMVIAGRYLAGRHLGTGLRGSANKVYWPITGRYRAEEFTAVPEVELVVAADGSIVLSGLPGGGPPA